MSFIDDLFNGIFGFFNPKKPEPSHPANTPAQPPATPAPKDQGITPEQIKAGLDKFAPNTPLASASGDLAEAAKRMPKNVDPLLPAVVALMETRGGLDNIDPKKKTGKNNVYNLFGTQNGQYHIVDYPDLKTAINGGENNGVKSKGFVGTVLEHPAYAQFRKTGDLADFFKSYTPPGAEHGNPELPQLLDRYQQLRDLFQLQMAVAAKKKAIDTLQGRANSF